MQKVRAIHRHAHPDRLLVIYDCGHKWLHWGPGCYLTTGCFTLCPTCAAVGWEQFQREGIYRVQLLDGAEYYGRVVAVFPANPPIAAHALFSTRGGKRVTIWQDEVFKIFKKEA